MKDLISRTDLSKKLNISAKTLSRWITENQTLLKENGIEVRKNLRLRKEEALFIIEKYRSKREFTQKKVAADLGLSERGLRYRVEEIRKKHKKVDIPKHSSYSKSQVELIKKLLGFY